MVVPPAVVVPNLSMSADNMGWYLQAQVAAEFGDDEAAERALLWSTRTAPMNPHVHIAWGDYLRDHGDYDAAKEAYRRSLSLAGLPAAHLGLGRLYLADDDAALAEPHIRAAVGLGDVSGYPGLVTVTNSLFGREAAIDTLRTWSLVENVAKADRLRRMDIATALGRSGLAAQDARWMLEQQPDPVIGNMLLQSAREGCALGLAWTWAIENVYLSQHTEWASFFEDVARVTGDTHLAPSAVGVKTHDTVSTVARIKPISSEYGPPECDADALVVLSRHWEECASLAILERAVEIDPLNGEALSVLAGHYQTCGMPVAAEQVRAIEARASVIWEGENP